MKTRLFFLFLALLLFATVAPLHAIAAPAEVYDGMAIDLAGFTPQQEQTIRDGLALFDNMASPQLQRPALLRMSAVPGSTSTTIATWQTTPTVNAGVTVGGQSVGVIAHTNDTPHLVDVTITFGVDRLGVGQVVHELIHVMQLYNPAWGEQERAFAAAHPYPQSGMGLWLNVAAPEPESELCPRVVESLFEVGAGMAAYAETQPDTVRWCLAHLSNP